MAYTTTVTGANNQVITLTFSSPSYVALADKLLAATPPVVITSSGNSTIPAGQDATVIEGGAPIQVIDANRDSGQVVIDDTPKGMTFFTTGGSGTVLGGSNSSSTYALNAGNWTLETSAAGSIAFLGTGNDQVAMGGPDTVVAGTGSSTVFGAAANNAVVFANSGPVLYVGGAGSASVIGGSGPLTAFGGSGTGNYFLGSGPASIIGGSGTTNIIGQASSGPTSVFGAAGGTLNLYGGGGHEFLVAGGGDETLNGFSSSGSNVFFAGSGPDVLIGGSGRDTLVAGHGNDTFLGFQNGAAANVFAFVDGITGGTGTTDDVFNLNISDSIELLGYGTNAYTTGTDGHGNAELLLSDGTTIIFAGVSSIDTSQIFKG